MTTNYTNIDFFEYFNRHVEGFLLLRNELKSIKGTYELASAFSNLTCRFSFNLEFLDLKNFDEEKQEILNKHFHNSLNQTGSQYVSFKYQSQSASFVDIETIRSFITHYEFAEQFLNGSIKKKFKRKMHNRI